MVLCIGSLNIHITMIQISSVFMSFWFIWKFCVLGLAYPLQLDLPLLADIHSYQEAEDGEGAAGWILWYGS